MLLPIQIPNNQTITLEWVKISQSSREKSFHTRETTRHLLRNNLRWRGNIFHLISHVHLPLITMREATLNRGILDWDIAAISKIIKQEHCTTIRSRSLLQLFRLQTQPIYNKGNINVINSSLSMVVEMNKSPMIWINSKVPMVKDNTRWMIAKLIKSISPGEKWDHQWIMMIWKEGPKAHQQRNNQNSNDRIQSRTPTSAASCNRQRLNNINPN